MWALLLHLPGLLFRHQVTPPRMREHVVLELESLIPREGVRRSCKSSDTVSQPRSKPRQGSKLRYKWVRLDKGSAKTECPTGLFQKQERPYQSEARWFVGPHRRPRQGSDVL